MRRVLLCPARYLRATLSKPPAGEACALVCSVVTLGRPVFALWRRACTLPGGRLRRGAANDARAVMLSVVAFDHIRLWVEVSLCMKPFSALLPVAGVA